MNLNWETRTLSVTRSRASFRGWLSDACATDAQHVPLGRGVFRMGVVHLSPVVQHPEEGTPLIKLHVLFTPDPNSEPEL
eukprot:5289805-Prymnesium_polylepis.2